MSPEIFLAVMSKDRPTQLDRFLTLIKRSALNTEAFSFHIILDDNQKDLYAPVIKEHNISNLSFVPHQEPGLNKCFREVIDRFLESGSYFLLNPPDDVFGIIHHWDKYIIEKKNSFIDDLFILHSGSRHFGRDPKIHMDCYNIKPDNLSATRLRNSLQRFKHLDINNQLDRDFIVSFEYCELFPVITHRVAEIIRPIFEQNSSFASSDLIISCFIQQLYRISGQRRSVLAWPDSFRVINDMTTETQIKQGSVPYDMNRIIALAQKAHLYIMNHSQHFFDRNKGSSSFNQVGKHDFI